MDRNLSDEELIAALRSFGFTVVPHYEHYTTENAPDPQLVPDERIISDCAANGWALLTADGKLEYRHFTTIKKCHVAIFIVPSNEKHALRWAEAMVKGRAAIYRCINNYKLPFIARLSPGGTIYQLRCADQSNQSTGDCALLIKDGKIDYECAKKHRKKAG